MKSYRVQVHVVQRPKHPHPDGAWQDPGSTETTTVEANSPENARRVAEVAFRKSNNSPHVTHALDKWKVVEVQEGPHSPAGPSKRTPHGRSDLARPLPKHGVDVPANGKQRHEPDRYLKGNDWSWDKRVSEEDRERAKHPYKGHVMFKRLG
jgi:hypothetical protein